MRGYFMATSLVAVAVLLQGAAKVNQLQDIGMGQSMQERVISAPASITAISTIPTGLVFGPVGRAKDGSLVYKIILPKDGQGVTINAIIGGRAATLRVGNYPLKWAPAQPAQVATKMQQGNGGNQSSTPVATTTPTPNSNLNGWELNGNFVQDTRGWFADNNPGTMTQGNSALRGTFQVSKGVGIFGEVAGSLTQDRSANWETNAHLGQNLAGFGGGLTSMILPRTTLSVGLRYFVDVPMGIGAINSPNLFAEVKGSDGNRLSYGAKVSTNAFKDIGGMVEGTAKLNPNWGISVIGVAKHYASGSNDYQVGVGPKWFPTATDSVSVGAYIMTPTTTAAPPAVGITFGIKF